MVIALPRLPLESDLPTAHVIRRGVPRGLALALLVSSAIAGAGHGCTNSSMAPKNEDGLRKAAADWQFAVFEGERGLPVGRALVCVPGEP